MIVPLLRVPTPWPYALWLSDLDTTLSPEAMQTLSDEERLRAGRFAFDLDRSRYTSAHVMLRAVLARQTGAPADALRFHLGPHGKPTLANARGSFNMSHSDGAMAVLWADDGRTTEIGVDLERRRRIAEMDDLVEEHFTRAERDAYAETARTHRTDAFLRGWTRKEAVLKALGTGFSVPARAIDAGLESHARVLTVEWDGQDAMVEVESVPVPGAWCCAVARWLPETSTSLRPLIAPRRAAMTSDRALLP